MSEHKPDHKIDKKDNSQLKDTLVNLQDALKEWDQIPDAPTEKLSTELEEFKKKTRLLLEKLNEQIKALGL